MGADKALYDAYGGGKELSPEQLWNTIKLLAFVYAAARIQGIREERIRRQKKQGW